MSLKSVDMQIAVHRSHEASVNQQQLNQKPSNDQALLGLQHEKQAKLDRQKTGELEESPQANIHDDQSGKRDQRSRREGRDQRNQDEETEQAIHPYKGKHIDISL